MGIEEKVPAGFLLTTVEGLGQGGALETVVDGHLDPSGTTRAYAKAARKLGIDRIAAADGERIRVKTAMVRSRMTMKLASASTSPAANCRDGAMPALSGLALLIVPYLRETSISTSIDSPTRKGCFRSSAGSSSIRTGRRWTVLIQLPVAFWAGITAIDDPVPPAKPVILP